jgi:hypothetical protein
VELDFEWDEDKAKANLEKHGIAFEDARLVFLDSKRLVREDKRRAYGETRFQTIGKVSGRVLFVAYTTRGTSFRLISARRASSEETEEFYGRSDK